MKALEFIIKVALPYKKYFAAIALAIIVLSVIKNLIPYLIKNIIDSISNNNYDNIYLYVLVYAVAQALLVLSWWTIGINIGKYLSSITNYIIKTLLSRVNLYSYRFFQEQLSGSISSKISDAAKRIPQIIEVCLLEFLQISITVAITIFILSRVHYGFAIAIIMWLSSFIILSYFILNKARKLSSSQAEVDSRLWGKIVDYISNMFSVKLFANVRYEETSLQSNYDDLYDKTIKRELFLNKYYTLQGILFSMYILGCIYGMVHLSRNNIITPGDFALVLMLNFEIVNWLFALSDILRQFITNWGTVERSLLFFENIPEVQDKIGAKKLVVTQGEIIFDKVQFFYKGSEPLFNNKSLTIHSGEKVGLVGYSGGGKSTFANLILRLYDVCEGSIKIDGQNIKEVTQDSLRENIAMIPQDLSLFNRSLMENIRYGCVEASNDMVIEAAKKAYIDDFVSKLPDGYNTMVGERGVKLSGGQRQRIAIARAFLKNAPILILDEATSQLDSITESVIQESLWELMQGKTTLVIAHRLSTLLHMNRILVFSNGKIIEDGNHKDLIKKDGLYKTLWSSQIGGFLPDQ
jgi:ATP-binding cassette, subfamily B, bacterial